MREFLTTLRGLGYATLLMVAAGVLATPVYLLLGVEVVRGLVSTGIGLWAIYALLRTHSPPGASTKR